MVRPRNIVCAALIAGLLVSLTAPVSAQEVELNPGYINGTIQIGSEIISQYTIQANSYPLTGSYVATPSANSDSYSLTVQVEPLGSTDWDVYADVYMDGYSNFLRLPTTTVTVVDGTSSVLDFVINPCIAEGEITVVGGTVSSTWFYAQEGAPSYQSYAYSSGYAQPPMYEPPITYRVVLVPDTQYTLTPQITLDSGTAINAPTIEVNCAAGATVTNDITVEAPSASISGSIDFEGTETPDVYIVSAYGPASKTEWLYPPFGPINDTTYDLTDLPDGTFTLYSYVYFNGYQDYFQFPLSSYSSAFSPANQPEISGGSSPVVNISAIQSFLEGTVTLSGTVDSSDLDSLTVVVRTSDYQGYAQSTTGTAGNYRLIVSPDTWGLNNFYLSLFRPTTDPDGYLQEQIYTYEYYEYDPATGMEILDDFQTVAAGETEFRDYDLAMGSITITFSIAGGGVFSNPQLYAWCQEIDEITGQYLRGYQFYSYSTDQIDVSAGQVSMVGLKGDCTVNAEAVVNGSTTSFGQFPITVVPGVDQQIEIGGPSLSLDIESGLCIDAEEITATGLATDDVSVASVTVNGIAAALTSSNNPSDPNEVSFSVPVAIPGRGPHEIVTVATDGDGKTAVDTRTVVNDDGQPVLSFTPDDGTTYPVTQTSVLVEGSVSDESGASVTINGNAVMVDASGAFSGSVDVSFGINGDNFITVAANDNSCASTVITHKVILIDNQPPVAMCQNVTVATGAICSADADVNNGSSDPDGDPITLTPSPASPYSLGSTEVTLTVDDGSASDSCIATVMVEDLTAPVIALDGDVAPTLQCGVDSYTEPGATASDVCDTDVPVTTGGSTPNPAVPGSYDITYDATDDSSNSAAQKTRTVAVVDTIAPTISTCAADRELLADPVTGLVSVPDLASETAASDACNLTVSQDVSAGTQVGAGSHVVTITASDGVQTAECTATLTVLDRLLSSEEKVKVHFHDHDGDGDSDSDSDSDPGADSDAPHCFTKLDLDGQLTLRNPAAQPIDVREGLEAVAGRLVVSLAGFEISDQTVVLEVKDGNDEKWEYKREGDDPDLGLKKIKLDWKDQAEYDSHEGSGLGSDVPQIETRFIGFDETDIKMSFKDVARPFTVEFVDGAQTITVTVLDEDGNISIAPAGSYEFDDKKDSLEVVLPFRLTPNTVITWTDSLAASSSIPVDPDVNYTVSSAKYMVDLDQTAISNALCGPDPLVDLNSLANPTLDIEIRLGSGTSQVVGSIVVDPAGWDKLSGKHWEVKR